MQRRMEDTDAPSHRNVQALAVSSPGLPVPASDTSEAVATRPESTSDVQHFQWTPRTLLLSVILFGLAAAAEVGGGWLVWQAIREHMPWWWGLFGSIVLLVYGFIPTLQPMPNFGRTFAVYGGMLGRPSCIVVESPPMRML